MIWSTSQCISLRIPKRFVTTEWLTISVGSIIPSRERLPKCWHIPIINPSPTYHSHTNSLSLEGRIACLWKDTYHIYVHIPGSRWWPFFWLEVRPCFEGPRPSKNDEVIWVPGNMDRYHWNSLVSYQPKGHPEVVTMTLKLHTSGIQLTPESWSGQPRKHKGFRTRSRLMFFFNRFVLSVLFS